MIKSKIFNKKGFTIVELIVVVTIIAILATITIVLYTGINKQAIEVSLKSDLVNASRQLKLFQTDHSSYPSTTNCTITNSSTNMCLRFSPGNTYMYQYDNNASPQTFVLTATNTNINVSYRVTNNSAPVLYVATLPNAPTGLGAVSSGATQVTLNWTAATDNNSLSITNYKIYRGTSSGNETLVATLGNVLTYVNSGLTTGTNYFYKVTAVNSSSAEGPYSNEVNATPTGPVSVTVNGSAFTINSYDGVRPMWGSDYICEYDCGTAWTTGSTFDLSSYTNGTISAVTLSWSFSSYSGGSGGANRHIYAGSPRSLLYSTDTTNTPTSYGGSNLTTYVNSKKGTSCLISWEADNGGDVDNDIWGIEENMSNPTLSFTWTP